MKIKIAFDLDGTLTEWPGLAEMATVLALWGHERCSVTIITAVAGGNTPENRRQRKGMLCDTHDNAGCFITSINDPLFLVETADEKGEYCRDHGIDVFIDDTPEYIEAVKRISPKTCCLLVANRKPKA